MSKESSPGEVTQLLNGLKQGENDGYEQLISIVYGELRGVADRMMKGERKDHTLSPTALVHEAYMKLVCIERLKWNGRSHFFAIAATAMRRLLVDHAKAHRAQKRGGNHQRVGFEENAFSEPEVGFDVLALHDALDVLKSVDERQARVVELRYFGGLGVEEVAECLQVSPRTVKSDWRIAKLWLLRALSDDEPTEKVD